MVLLPVRRAGAPARDRIDQYRARPAAAVRYILCRSRGAPLSRLRRGSPRQGTTRGLGPNLISPLRPLGGEGGPSRSDGRVRWVRSEPPPHPNPLPRSGEREFRGSLSAALLLQKPP